MGTAGDLPRKQSPFIGNKEEGAEEAKRHTDSTRELSLSTDGSRLDSGYTEAHVAWRNLEWKTQKTYLRTNKEVLDEKLYAIGEALEVALQGDRAGHTANRQQKEPPMIKICILADSQLAIKQLQYMDPGPG